MSTPVHNPGDRFLTLDNDSTARLWLVQENGLVKIMTGATGVVNHVQQSYSVREVAKLMGVTTRTVWEWIKLGKLDSEKDGSARRISHEALEAYRAAR